MEQVLPSAEAVCVEYPAIVRNAEAALQTLGGAAAVARSESARNEQRFLSLRWRQEDPLAHPLYGDRHATAGLVLRVARKTRKGGKPEREGEQGGDGTDVTTAVVAVVRACYRYGGMLRCSVTQQMFREFP